MARYNQDWDDLGRNIQDIVDRAVNSHDFQKLDQTIRQVIDKAVDVGSEAVRKAAENGNRASTKSTGGYQQAKQAEVVETKNIPVLYGNTGKKTTGGILKIVGGGLLSGLGLMILLSSVVFDMLVSGAVSVTFPVIFSLASLGGGVGLIGSGVGTLGKVSRFKAYRKALGQKTHCTLENLARSVGKSVKFVRREVRNMIDQGLFLQGHLDKEETRLITSDETYRNFEQSRLQLEERKRQEAAAEAAKKMTFSRDARVQEVLDRGNAFLAEIRRCNDAIPGEEISEKISRMENIVGRIFDRAEEHPEIVPDLKKLMDYYLPMTIKLLNAYAEMDAQPVQGENIQASKREIEATLDTLNRAFEKLLDDLFRDTAMDVSSDISVLHTLLAQEGLTEDDFTRMKKQKTEGKYT